MGGNIGFYLVVASSATPKQKPPHGDHNPPTLLHAIELSDRNIKIVEVSTVIDSWVSYRNGRCPDTFRLGNNNHGQPWELDPFWYLFFTCIHGASTVDITSFGHSSQCLDAKPVNRTWGWLWYGKSVAVSGTKRAKIGAEVLLGRTTAQKCP